tara:strand:+ start:2466 stop:4412 length:1947 start_codon:yes stop_codon:yes gene_type:complete
MSGSVPLKVSQREECEVAAAVVSQEEINDFYIAADGEAMFPWEKNPVAIGVPSGEVENTAIEFDIRSKDVGETVRTGSVQMQPTGPDDDVHPSVVSMADTMAYAGSTYNPGSGYTAYVDSDMPAAPREPVFELLRDESSSIHESFHNDPSFVGGNQSDVYVDTVDVTRSFQEPQQTMKHTHQIAAQDSDQGLPSSTLLSPAPHAHTFAPRTENRVSFNAAPSALSSPIHVSQERTQNIPMATSQFELLRPQQRKDAQMEPEQFQQPASSSGLTYSSLAHARAVIAQRHVEHDWQPDREDQTIPRTNQQREAYVLQLLNAMNDTSEARDSKGKNTPFNNRWVLRSHNNNHFYKMDEMEAVCWDILDLAERLHAHGPIALSIYDPAALGEVRKSKSLTFDKRIGFVCQAMRMSKARCDSLMKGDGLATLVGSPSLKVRGTHLQKNQNARRAETIEKGRQVEKAERDMMNLHNLADDVVTQVNTHQRDAANGGNDFGDSPVARPQAKPQGHSEMQITPPLIHDDVDQDAALAAALTRHMLEQNLEDSGEVRGSHNHGAHFAAGYHGANNFDDSSPPSMQVAHMGYSTTQRSLLVPEQDLRTLAPAHPNSYQAAAHLATPDSTGAPTASKRPFDQANDGSFPVPSPKRPRLG